MSSPILNTRDFDFAPKSMTRDLRQVSRWSWCALFVLCIVAIRLGHLWFEQHALKLEQTKKLDYWTRAIAQQESKSTLPTKTLETKDADKKAELTKREIASELNFPWSDLFDVIEEQTKDVAVLSVEPQLKQGKIKISAEAKSRADMNQYLRNLERQTIIRSVTLLSFEINQQDPLKPVRFQYEMIWTENIK